MRVAATDSSMVGGIRADTAPCSLRAEVMEPDKIPADLRYFGNEFPFLGKAVLLPKDEITVPAKDTGNKRCA